MNLATLESVAVTLGSGHPRVTPERAHADVLAPPAAPGPGAAAGAPADAVVRCPCRRPVLRAGGVAGEAGPRLRRVRHRSLRWVGRGSAQTEQGLGAGGVRPEVRGGGVQHDAALLHHRDAVRDSERQSEVLLHHEH